MSHQAAPDLTLPAPSVSIADRPAQLPLTAAMIFGIAGLFLFLSSQILVIAAAVIWAVGTSLHLAIAGFSVLGTAVGAPVAWLIWKILVMAIQAERDPANN
ncbi:hypothetical protein [Oricola sp.]|uniref:hypothetical protein n=1 Tax=Oricola sp. TaxID=1979950 RepID=UPI0025FB7F3D|nr:hypothetical protein [Oricola sp.]MCI5077222.1 hypothetical protein [Oricola sp.]